MPPHHFFLRLAFPALCDHCQVMHQISRTSVVSSPAASSLSIVGWNTWRLYWAVQKRWVVVTFLFRCTKLYAQKNAGASLVCIEQPAPWPSCESVRSRYTRCDWGLGACMCSGTYAPAQAFCFSGHTYLITIQYSVWPPCISACRRFWQDAGSGAGPCTWASQALHTTHRSNHPCTCPKVGLAAFKVSLQILEAQFQFLGVQFNSVTV